MATVYLNALTGNDSNTYVQAQNPATPWLTPGKVQTSATTGDTVVMAAGTYAWETIGFTKEFTWTGASLSSGFPTTILDGAGTNVYWLVCGTTNFSNLKFQNVIHASQYNSIIGTDNTGSAATITFTNCRFTNIQLRNDLTGGIVGEFLQTAIITLTNCLFDNISRVSGGTGAALISEQSSGNLTLTLINCVISLATGGTSQITHLFKKTTSLSITLKNNIFNNSTGGTLTACSGTPTWTSVLNDDFYLITSAPTGTNCITSQPLFCDTSSANFNLRPTSPCIDTGVIP